MKNNTLKSILSSILVISLCVSLIAGSTFALFTSESKVNVAVTAGNVDVVATVENLELGTTLESNIDETTATSKENTVTLDKIVHGDYVTFDLRIENNSDVTVKYRTVIKKVEDNGLWDGLTVTIDGTVYDGASKMSAWETLVPGSEDIIVPVKVALPENAGNEYKLKTCTFAYTVEAVQGNVDTDTIVSDASELDTTIEDGETVTLINDISLKAANTSGYGATGVVVNGGTLNGDNYSLDVTGANNTWDSAVNAKSGTIKNLTIGSAFRGIFMSGATGDVVIDNVVIDNVCYTFNSDAGSKDYSVTIKNSTLNGWTSYSDVHKLVSFENCKFGAGTGGYKYAFMRPYNATIITNCVFEEGFEIDARNSVVLDNCYYGDTLITSENISELGLIYNGEDYVTVIDYSIVDGVYYAYTSAGIDAAIKDDATTISLGSGNFIIPDSAQGKTLTIIGNGETVVDVQDDGSYEGCDYSLDGSTVTFEGITINTDSTTYTGYARLNATYNNCTIDGTYTLYGNSEFNNCTFNVTGDVYNIWTWGGKTVEFNNCTFNSDGKSVLVYNQSCDVYVNDCTFNDRTNGTGFTKSALETGVDKAGAATYNIYINNTTVNGFAENDTCVGYKNIVGNKNSISNTYLNIVVDGVDVY